MAPEMIRTKFNHKRTYGIQVDVWSFGIFAVEIALREPPHFDIDLQGPLFQSILRTPEPICSLDPTEWSE